MAASGGPQETPRAGEAPLRFGGGGDGRSWVQAVGRGLRKRCPECGRGEMFSGYAKTAATCGHCALDLTGHRADDAPPYLTIMLVGHVAIPLALAAKQIFDPPLSVQFAFWTPAILLATFWLLPITKGAMVGLQWANRMHGFAGADADPKADA